MFKELDNLRGITTLLNNLGDIARYEGDHERAHKFYTESLGLQQKAGEKRDVASCLDRLGYIARLEGASRRAAILFGAADGLREAAGDTVPASSLDDHERNVAATKASLGEEAFDAAWSQGRSMEVKKAIAYAIGVLTNV
jgi:Tetratricopeptide repeat